MSEWIVFSGARNGAQTDGVGYLMILGLSSLLMSLGSHSSLLWHFQLFSSHWGTLRRSQDGINRVKTHDISSVSAC